MWTIRPAIAEECCQVFCQKCNHINQISHLALACAKKSHHLQKMFWLISKSLLIKKFWYPTEVSNFFHFFFQTSKFFQRHTQMHFLENHKWPKNYHHKSNHNRGDIFSSLFFHDKIVIKCKSSVIIEFDTGSLLSNDTIENLKVNEIIKEKEILSQQTKRDVLDNLCILSNQFFQCFQLEIS